MLLPLGMRFPGAFVININSYIYDVSSTGPFGLQGISVSSPLETDADLLYIYMFHIYIYLHNVSILRHFGSSLLELTKVVLRLKSFLPLHFIVLA